MSSFSKKLHVADVTDNDFVALETVPDGFKVITKIGGAVWSSLAISTYEAAAAIAEAAASTHSIGCVRFVNVAGARI